MANTLWTCGRCLLAAAVVGIGSVAMGAGSPAPAGLQPRIGAARPGTTVFDPVRHDPSVMVVKFIDDLPVDAINGVLGDKGTGWLDEARNAVDFLGVPGWRPMHALPEAQLDQLRATAEANLGREIADLTASFYFDLPAGMDITAACDALLALDVVERAKPNALPMPAPGIPDFEDSQFYLDPATDGVNAECMWNVPGGTGGNVAICDIEYAWNLNHVDLPNVTQLSADPTDPFNSTNHGTAVLGEMAGIPNGFGVTGICYDSTFFVAGAHHSGSYNLPQGLSDALGTLGQGDLILIEQQYAGPNWPGGNTQFGLVPSEWDEDVYNIIVVAVGNGVCVVEAAGNGSQDLDDPVYNAGHAPFLPANDSGAIMVGAGGPPTGGSDRQRLSFSNYGATVDLQGIGSNVTTTGYGDLYMGAGINEWYTSSFSGTSSSSPIVTGAAALLQSAYFQQTGSYLTCEELKNALIVTGSPQLGDTSEHIGPRPDAAGAYVYLFPQDDCNNNGIPDECDDDCNNNGVPDDCDIDPTDPDGDGIVIPDCNSNGVPDDCDIDPTDPDGDGMVSPDCQPNGVPDECDLMDGTSQDCNENNIPDECDIADATSLDCQPNGIPDECEIWQGSSAPGGPFFCTMNCDPDCNYNGIPDECDIADGTSQDCNGNMIPDECDTTPQLWSIDKDAPTLHLLDAATGATIRSLPLFDGLAFAGGNGLACDPTTGALWCVLRTGGCNRHLCSIDLITGELNVVGNLNECFAGITFSGDGTLWGVTGDGANTPESLYTISTADASSVFVGALGAGNDGEAIAWNPDDGLIYHASGYDGPPNDPVDGPIWETVDPGSWIIDPLILDGIPGEDFNDEILGLTYDPWSGGFLASNLGDEYVHRTAAGFQAQLGNLDHTSKGLAFTKLYSLDCNENQIPDECEISDGTAIDCNNNGILDDCELQPEFDPNAAQPRDFCQHAEYVCTGITYNGDTFDATSEYLDFPGGTIDGLFTCGSRVGLYDVWYKYRPSADGLMFVHVEGPGAGLEWIFGIYDACPVGGGNLLDCNVFQHHGTISMNVEQGECYWIRIAATNFSRGAFVMDLVGPDCVLNENDLNANNMLDDCECPWDVNNDGVVDFMDFQQVVAAIGQPCAGCPEDVEKDGDVDMNDAQSVFLNFGNCPENVICANPGTCGTLAICAGAGDPMPCYCVERYDGQGGICLREFMCAGAVPCPTGDCPPGYICVVNTCCGGNVCAPLEGCEGNPDGLPNLAIPGGNPTVTGMTSTGRIIEE